MWTIKENPVLLFVFTEIPRVHYDHLSDECERISKKCEAILKMYGLTPQKPEQKEYELVEVVEVLKESVLFKRKGMVLALPYGTRRSKKTEEKIRNFLFCLPPK